MLGFDKSTFRKVTGLGAGGAGATEGAGAGTGACLATAGLAAIAGRAYGLAPILGIRLVGCLRLDFAGVESDDNDCSTSLEIGAAFGVLSNPTRGYGSFEVRPALDDEEARLWAVDAELAIVARANEGTVGVLEELAIDACTRDS